MVGWQKTIGQTRDSASLNLGRKGPPDEGYHGGRPDGCERELYGMRMTVRIANDEVFTRTYWPSTKRHS